MMFSIVIPTYNRKEEILKCVASLKNLDFKKDEYEIVVVDDCSSDGTYEALKNLSISLVRLEKRSGPAKARNEGIKAARGEYIVFTDSDCDVPLNWLTEFGKAYQKNEEISGVGGGVINDGRSIWCEYETFIYKNYQKEPSEYMSKKRDELPFVLMNISYKKSVLQEVGYFDETIPYFISGEDANLKEKVLKHGGFFLFIPINVVHKRRYSFASFYKQSLERGAGMLLDSKRKGKMQSRLEILLRLLISPVYPVLSLYKMKGNFKLAFVETLFFVFKNLGKLKYYKEVEAL